MNGLDKNFEALRDFERLQSEAMHMSLCKKKKISGDLGLIEPYK